MSGDHCLSLISAKFIPVGRSNVLPGAVMFSIFGATGQLAFSKLDAARSQASQEPSKPLMQRILDSRWMPMRRIPDDEYADRLNEALLKVDAEIAIIDDRIAEIRSSSPSKDSDP